MLWCGDFEKARNFTFLQTQRAGNPATASSKKSSTKVGKSSEGHSVAKRFAPRGANSILANICHH